MEIEVTTTSSKGQIVIPADIREKLHMKAGTKFAVFGKNDSIILKKIELPTMEDFERLVEWGTKFAKKKRIKPADIEKIIHKHRGIK